METKPKNEAKYQELMAKHVMVIYERVQKHGSRGEKSKNIFARLRTDMKTHTNRQS